MKETRSTSLFDRAILSRAAVDAFAKLHPARMMKNPVMFIVEVGALATTLFLLPGLVAEGPLRVPAPDRLLALGDRPLRELRRGRRRGPRQGAGGRAPEDEDRHGRAPHLGRREAPGGGGDRLDEAPQGRPRRRRDGRDDPRRRDRRRGHRLRERIGDHGRVGARHPRGRRGPVRRHGRDDGPLRPHRRRDHVRARPDVPRPDDQASSRAPSGRRRRTRSRSTSSSRASRSCSSSQR